ncbi:MAG: hypothetical protein K6F84_05390 [Lachnospiraceae bacterium]|nr:hypothetical protein [Lachnospiraceae bacterium]
MTARHMSDRSIKIASIRNLNMVNFYRIFDENNDLSCIMVYYDNSEIINLSETDEGFFELLEKVTEVYSLEENQRSIIADDFTRELLKTSACYRTKEYERLTSLFDETKEPDLFPNAYSHKMMLPIVRYVMESIYGVEGIKIEFNDYVREWYGRGSLNARSESVNRSFPFVIRKLNGTLYRVEVSNVLKKYKTLTVNILHSFDGITVDYSASSYSGILRVSFIGEEPVMNHVIKLGDKEVFWAKENMKPFEETDNANIYPSFSRVKWESFILPWKERVMTAREGALQYRLYSAGSNKKMFSFGICNHVLRNEGINLGRICMFAYLIFESPLKTELHFLDAVSPAHWFYRENYESKKYILNKERNQSYGDQT